MLCVIVSQETNALEILLSGAICITRIVMTIPGVESRTVSSAIAATTSATATATYATIMVNAPTTTTAFFGRNFEPSQHRHPFFSDYYNLCLHPTVAELSAITTTKLSPSSGSGYSFLAADNNNEKTTALIPFSMIADTGASCHFINSNFLHHIEIKYVISKN